MIWAILIPILALAIFLTVRAVRKSYDEPAGLIVGSIFSWFGVAIAIICVCVLTTEYLGFNIIDNKIEVLQQENAIIEQRVAETVKQYQDYETGIFTDATQDIGSDVVVLIERYPELKSNELVKQQLDLYIENNQEIKDLKLEQLKKYKYELWLFFDLTVD